VADDDAARGGAPARKIAANRVCAKWSSKVKYVFLAALDAVPEEKVRSLSWPQTSGLSVSVAIISREHWRRKFVARRSTTQPRRYFRIPYARDFPRLMFQTRYQGICCEAVRANANVRKRTPGKMSPRMQFARFPRREPAGCCPLKKMSGANSPAVAAVSAVATAPIPAAPATTTAITAAATAATTAAPTTPATAVTASAPAASSASFRLRLGFIHHQVAPAKILPVQSVDGLLRVFICGNLRERKSARLAREAIANQGYRGRRDANLGKPFLQLFFRRGKRQIPDIQFLHLRTPSVRNPRSSCGAR
jgi:hypothetical protein